MITNIQHYGNDCSSNNFITIKNSDGSFTYKMTGELLNKYNRRLNNCIAGDIIALFSWDKTISRSDLLLKRKDFSNAILFLIISPNFGSSYLVCPLCFGSLLTYHPESEYIVNLGICNFLRKKQYVFADLTKCHFIKKGEFHTYIENQKQILRELGCSDEVIFHLNKEKFAQVLFKCKKLLKY